MTLSWVSGPAASKAWRAAVVALIAGGSLFIAGCGDKPQEAGASQAAAKVNKAEVSVQEIDFVVQQQRGLRPEQAEAAARQILERLIDQELSSQKAVDLKLDRDPLVVQQLQAARREILSRAYLQKAGEAAVKPTPEEMASYYEANPALFRERRIYSLQEIAVEAAPDQIASLRAQLERARSVGDFIEYLRANDIRFSANQAVRAAEQLPIASLGSIAALKDGQAILSPTPSGAQVIVLAGSRSEPVTLEQARPAIEQYLLNSRRRDIIASDIKVLRGAASIEYVGKYAESAASAPASAASGGLGGPLK